MNPNAFTIEENTERTKKLRQEIDALLTAINTQLDKTRETALVVTKLQEARMWAGQNLANYSNDFQNSQFADKATEPKSL